MPSFMNGLHRSLIPTIARMRPFPVDQSVRVFFKGLIQEVIHLPEHLAFTTTEGFEQKLTLWS